MVNTYKNNVYIGPMNALIVRGNSYWEWVNQLSIDMGIYLCIRRARLEKPTSVSDNRLAFLWVALKSK